jgi:uncharacterized protein with HEPN domain
VRDQVYLQHILDAVEKIESYTAIGREAFIADSHWQDAVIRQWEVTQQNLPVLKSQIQAILAELG